jgi:hypothetical protein|tara:strand:- start:1044 stop:1418 length:375 start_codon:yes stop_codon:yes gene_type:complete
MTVHFNIDAAEWSFKEELPFDIIRIKDELKDFELPLYDEDDNETERVILPNCRVIELIGEDESFLVILELALIHDAKVEEISDTEQLYNIALKVDMPVWQQGEGIGVFYSWKNLPADLQDMKFG